MLRDPMCEQSRSTTTWGFPLPPKSGPESQPDPAGEGYQHLRRLAEAEIAAPAIRGQLFHCRLDADTLGPSRDLPDSLLEPLQGFRRDDALDLRTSRDAEPKELPFLRSCHRALRFIYLELLCDEARNALHHPLTRSLAPNINVTVVRVANKAMSSVLQFPVEFVEHEVTQQWRERSPLWGPFHARTDQPVIHHPSIEKCSDELQQPLVLDPLGDLAHQFVVINSIEKFFQIKINHPSIACRDILLRLSHGLMCRPTRSEPIAVLGKRRVPLPLQNLHHRLLDKTVQHGWDAKFPHPSAIRLGDFHPSYRFRFIGSVQQLLLNGRPVLFQVVAELIDGHPVDPGTAFVSLHLPQCSLQVSSLTYLLHCSARMGWAFGFTIRCTPWPSMPSADFCSAVRPPLGCL